MSGVHTVLVSGLQSVFLKGSSYGGGRDHCVDCLKIVLGASRE